MFIYMELTDMKGTRLNVTRLVIFGLALFSFSMAAVHAQQSNLSIADKTSRAPGRQSSSDDEEDLIEPSRPTIANAAEFQKPGVLQIEYGYDGNFRSDEFRSQQSAPLTIRFAPFERLLFDFGVDTVISESDESGTRETDVGDTRIGIQLLAFKEARRPALAFAYYVKLPTASADKNLGTGRTDHRLVALLSKKFGKNEVDFNVAYLNVGRQFGDRRASGGQAALSVSRQFKNNFGIIAEIAGQSEDDVQPKGIFALGAATYKVNKRLQFDAGMRFGLNRAAPRIGIFAGFTVGIGKPFKK
jgi:hypothetical protein